jgi:hypothetical protein
MSLRAPQGRSNLLNDKIASSPNGSSQWQIEGRLLGMAFCKGIVVIRIDSAPPAKENAARLNEGA